MLIIFKSDKTVVSRPSLSPFIIPRFSKRVNLTHNTIGGLKQGLTCCVLNKLNNSNNNDNNDDDNTVYVFFLQRFEI